MRERYKSNSLQSGAFNPMQSWRKFGCAHNFATVPYGKRKTTLSGPTFGKPGTPIPTLRILIGLYQGKGISFENGIV